MDVRTRQIMGYCLDHTMTKDLVCSALRTACALHCLAPGTLIHSDQGSQYRSRGFIDLITTLGIITEHEPTRQLLGQCRGREFLCNL